MDDEENRTTPIGLFHYGDSYLMAAKALRTRKVRTTHPDAPIQFLHYHAVELYLKAWLRLHGATLKELRTLGHGATRLAKRAEALGLHFDDEDHEVISLMAGDVVIRSRYLKTGYFKIPHPDALDRTCKSFRRSIYEEMKKRKMSVRAKVVRPKPECRFNTD